MSDEELCDPAGSGKLEKGVCRDRHLPESRCGTGGLGDSQSRIQRRLIGRRDLRLAYIGHNELGVKPLGDDPAVSIISWMLARGVIHTRIRSWVPNCC